MRRAVIAVLLASAAAAAAFAQSDATWEASSGLIRSEGFVLFFNSRGPLSFATLTPGSVPAGAVKVEDVKGRGCQFGLSLPIVSGSVPRFSGAGGNGGFEKALRDIQNRYPDLKGIYDVKVDDHILSVLTVYVRQCVEITARGFK